MFHVEHSGFKSAFRGEMYFLDIDFLVDKLTLESHK